VAAYNAGHYISAALDSLLAQSFQDFEVIVVDDGSSDNTAELVGAFVRRDQRFRLLENDVNKGLVFTRNRTLEESRGELIAIVDADDICEPDRLAVQVSYIDANQHVGMLGSDVTLIDDTGRELGFHSQSHHGEQQVRFFLMFGPCVHNPTTMYRRDLVEKAGGYSGGFDAGAEDYDLWSRLSGITAIVNLPQRLVRYRKHSGSITADRTRVDENIFAISAGLLSRYLGNPVTGGRARLLHLWLIRQGMQPNSCREAMSFAQAIWRRAVELENSETLAQLGEILAASAWSHAQYLVYADRGLSLELSRFATRLPHVTRHTGRLAYATRLATPHAIRSLVKSLSGRS
jgi:glycosyltransferase involved in cell wall biosynthesis